MADPKGGDSKPKPQTDRVRAEARAAVMAQGARDGKVSELFLAWAGQRVYEDTDTHKVIGVDGALADYKAENAFLFAPPASAAATGRVKRTYVDADRDITLQIGISWVTFRPNQRLDDPYAIALAKSHGIALVEK